MVTRPGTLQASFNSGEVAPELYNRNDVKQFYASASHMENVEPVPQGGFRLAPRSRDLGPARTSLAALAGTVTSTASLAGAGEIARVEFGASRSVAVVRWNLSSDAAVADGLQVQWRDAAGVWHAFGPVFQLAAGYRQLSAGLAPSTSVAATAIRLWYAGGSAITILFGYLAAFAETGQLGQQKLVAFSYSAAEIYQILLTDDGNADVYRAGVYVGTVWHGLSSGQLAGLTTLQRLDTLMLFHPDHGQYRIMRHGTDHDWGLEPLPLTETPDVDLGGTYAKTAEVWQLLLRYVSGESPVGLIFNMTVDGEDSSVVGVNTWEQVATDIKTQLEALATVKPGVTVTQTTSLAGYQVFDITFGGDNAGDLFTFSAKFTNTATAGASTIRITKGDPGGEPLFSDARGFPTCGLFYQDRFVQGGFRSKPGAVLASPSADYFSGNIKVETATGGLLLNIDTDGAETIRQMVQSKHLVIFTDQAEYFAADRVLDRTKATNIVESSRNGSCPTVPICKTETSLLYVSAARSLVYQATYDDVSVSYVSDPISLLAKHLITAINGAAMQRPDDAIDAGRYYMVRDDGLMPVGYLIRSQDVTAFVRWTTDGTVKAVMVDGANVAYLLVERLIGGVARRRLERLERGLWVDGAVTGTLDGAGTGVSGLDMHEGAAVWAIADGYALGPFTVAGGAITLPVPAASVTVGRWTPPRVTTLPLPRDVGPRIVLERPCRVHTVQLKLIGTTSIALGANGGAAADVALYRAGMPTDVPQPAVTDWLELGGLAGFSIDGQVTITQLRPGALQVASVVVQART